MTRLETENTGPKLFGKADFQPQQDEAYEGGTDFSIGNPGLWKFFRVESPWFQLRNT